MKLISNPSKFAGQILIAINTKRIAELRAAQVY